MRVIESGCPRKSTAQSILGMKSFGHLKRLVSLVLLLACARAFTGIASGADAAPAVSATTNSPALLVTNAAVTHAALTNPLGGTNRMEATNAPSSDADCGPTLVVHGWVRTLAFLYLIFGTIAVFFYVWLEMKQRRVAYTPGSVRDEMQNIRRSNLFFLPIFHVAFSAVMLYLCYPPLGTVMMHAVAWFSLGTLMGLIFSVPKSSGQRPPPPVPPTPPAAGASHEAVVAQNAQKRRSQYETNNNLVEVSDWLTKIIVGLGLIHLKDAPSVIKRVVAPLKCCLGDCYLAFGTALLLGFSALGFLFGYVFTRLFLVRAFSDADPSEDVAEGDQRLQERMHDTKAAIDKASPGLTVMDAGGAASDWEAPFLKLAEEYCQDQFASIFQRVSHKDKKADEMAALLAAAKAPKARVVELLKQNEAGAKRSDGIIAGFASYCLMRAEAEDLEVLLSVALAARRLHTRYRLIMAMRELLQRDFGSRDQFQQVRVVIKGWLADADDDLTSAIVTLEKLIERRYAPQS